MIALSLASVHIAVGMSQDAVSLAFLLFTDREMFTRTVSYLLYLLIDHSFALGIAKIKRRKEIGRSSRKLSEKISEKVVVAFASIRFIVFSIVPPCSTYLI